MLEDIR